MARNVRKTALIMIFGISKISPERLKKILKGAFRTTVLRFRAHDEGSSEHVQYPSAHVLVSVRLLWDVA